MSLARNQNNVARSGQRNSAIDCLRAIDDFFIAIRTKSFFDLRDDCVWVFLSRIIGRNDGVVGKAIYHLSHQRAFLPVAIAPAAENGNQSLRLEFAQSFENVPKRVGCVSVIDENLKLSFGWNQLQPPRHLRRLGETKHRVSQVDSQRIGRGQRRDGVGHVKPTN